MTFINRIGSRRLVDQEEYLDLLRFTLAHVEVRSVDFGAMSFHEQLEAARDTDVLVGVHGAGFTHIMFLKPHSAVVEILPLTLNHKGFRNVACITGHSYFSAHASEAPLHKGDDWHQEVSTLSEVSSWSCRSLPSKPRTTGDSEITMRFRAENG